jgi:hypothetical protein
MNKSSHPLKFKNTNKITLGLDIGGTLTKLSVTLLKELNTTNEFLTKYGFTEELELDEHFLYIKLLQTNKFEEEGIPLFKSRYLI